MARMKDGDARLWRDLQELVDRTGLKSGSLSIIFHDGTARKVKIKAEVILDQADEIRTLPAAREDDLLQFVRDRLETPIRDRIGLFGHADVFVEGGKARYLELCERLKLAG